MIATKRHTVEITEEETVWLLHKLGEVSFAFGPNYAALVWEKDEPMPEALRLIGLKRGVLNENCDGAGI
jgi:hypothetical protein